MTDAQGGDAAKGAGAGDVDINKIRQEIAADNQKFRDTLIAGIGTSVSTAVEAAMKRVPPPPPVATNNAPDLSEYGPEIEKLGLDEEQTAGLISLVGKLVGKDTKNLEGNILKTVDGNLDWKAAKKEIEDKTKSAYPDVLNPTGPLRTRATQIYEAMSPQAKSGYDAVAIAIERAARELNIEPVSQAQINANNAGNPTGGNGGDDSNKMSSEAEIAFAGLFDGVDEKAYKANLAKLKK